jgi:hypothetical protein
MPAQRSPPEASFVPVTAKQQYELVGVPQAEMLKLGGRRERLQGVALVECFAEAGVGMALRRQGTYVRTKPAKAARRPRERERPAWWAGLPVDLDAWLVRLAGRRAAPAVA